MKKMILLAALLAVGALATVAWASSSDKSCDGSCCASATTCVACCGDTGGCASCCK